MRLTYKHTLSGFLASHQDFICFQDGRVPCNLCCASAYSQICFRSASDQACLWAFSATGPGVLDGGFKGRIVAWLPRKRYGGWECVVRWDASKILFLGTLIKNTPPKKKQSPKNILMSKVPIYPVIWNCGANIPTGANIPCTAPHHKIFLATVKIFLPTVTLACFVRGHTRTQAIRGWHGPFTDGLKSKTI